MCDPLSRNAPASMRVILANCLAHRRRHFADVVKLTHPAGADRCQNFSRP
jgi:hypothetical protein